MIERFQRDAQCAQTAGIGILAGADQQVVVSARSRWRPAQPCHSLRTDSALYQPLQRERLFVGGLRSDNYPHRVGSRLSAGFHDARGCAAKRLRPSLLEHSIVRLIQRRGQPVLGLELEEIVPPLVAHPVVVDVGIVARLEAVDATAMVMDIDRASAFAPGADRRRAMQIPDTHAEAEIFLGKRADRTDINHVAGVLVVDGLARPVIDLVVIAAPENRQLAGMRNSSKKRVHRAHRMHRS